MDQQIQPVRFSDCVVMMFDHDRVLAYNYLQNKTSALSLEALQEISRLQDWQDLPEDFADYRQSFTECGLLLEKESNAAADEEKWQQDWEWGVPSALFHLSLRDVDFLSVEESTDRQLGKVAAAPQPAPLLSNQAFKSVTKLPELEETQLMEIMRKRRTVRDFLDEPVLLTDLSAMLYSGLGVTGVTQNEATRLVLGMTPSGGARNPYEGFVIARNVSGLPKGVYHYCGAEHSLGLVTTELPDRLGDVVGKQEWADDAPCLIVLCAFFERTMWKYDDPNAYRVALIEAGHIAQNVMLTGTDNGYTVCPTAALSHTELFELLELENNVTHCPLYVLAVGRPDRNSPDCNWQEIDPASTGSIL
ncbi:SagB/ThcOx family dehydrogenase [Notoacmeibacter sp. MSK16QG-6]|uniref:SagB/ThcOx family dehydrogenase n=1 Tax=Notoacmeibacter sp. MSK16QG-6 TaxID=2957982 RepID=UPI00209ED98C|nr:SagB/ThcOx family dehydrogenase [Notoacmeibacter sp. MSK16QG-6]MCP1199681.1 SagB/ThcOx family dehydrogenase [Notoacmeibacter sp. MSK16QG-6]